MRTIYKYNLAPVDEQTIGLHKNYEILSVQNQHGMITLWVMIDTDQLMTEVVFYVVGTGNPMPPRRFINFLGSVQIPPFVWHVFVERKWTPPEQTNPPS